eukprot:g29390.t1
MDAINQTLKKQKEAKKEEHRLEAEKKAKAMKALRREEEIKDEEDDTYQILDDKGLGNFMDKMEVMDIMKNTVKTAASQAGSRCQVSSRTVIGDKLFTNKELKFDSLGGMKAVKGFIYEPGVKLTLQRPATVYVALSKSPNEDDPFLQRWQTVSETDCALPEFSDDVAPVAEIKRKERHVGRGVRGLVRGVAERAGKSSSSTAKEGPTKQEELEAILKKAEAGEKLSNKEKRLLEKHNEKNAEYKNEDDEPVGGLHAFTITLEGGKLEPPTAGDAFVCNNFTLSAPKQTLFDNASVTIVQGHRYGILGPNGQGKTTLLRHIAAREMPVPLNWDVILVEQEAKATERSAVEEVLAADLKLLDGDTGRRTRLDLENTSAELEAIGADSAEARVRKILCGLGFTNGAPDEDRFSMDRPVVQFSGGWRMRISLAKALFLQPKLLMLDEPTNHLDLDAVLWLDNYLSEQYPHAVVVVRIAIVGPNGAGKSTILNLMMQQLEPCLGEVSVSKGIRVKQYHQHFEELLPLDKTGVDYLKDAFNLKTPENARAVLGQFGLPGGSHFTKIGNLSGGQKARKDFDGYRDKVLRQLEERQEEHLSDEQLAKAKQRKEGELAEAAKLNLQVVKDQKDVKKAEVKEKVEEPEEDEEEDPEAGCPAPADVKSVEVVKKKKGSFLVELETGSGTVPVVTHYEHLEEGQLVIFAPEGSFVQGKEVKRQKVAGESVAGMICGPSELGWSGDAAKAVVLNGLKVGATAPSSDPHGSKSHGHDKSDMKQKKPKGKDAKKEEEEAKEEDHEEGEEVHKERKKPRAKDKKAAGEKAPEEAKKEEKVEKAKEEEQEEPDNDSGGQHGEYKVAKVKSVESMKKKKGSFFVELETASGAASVVTSFDNLEEGQLVIFAPEGSSVLGKEVKRQKVAGEWAAGAICGPMEMGWVGDASKAVLLPSTYKARVGRSDQPDLGLQMAKKM